MFTDLTGKHYGRLTVLKQLSERQGAAILWLCRCTCGKETKVDTGRLNSGNTRSCGCLIGDTARTHGMHGTHVYKIWVGIKNRATNPNELYFQKGIRICKRWLKFENFIKDMGLPPLNTSIDRINNKKGYSKSNCRWASKTTQSVNRTCTRFITYQGKTQCLSHWAKEIGIGQDTLHYRIVQAKWSIEKALTTPVNHNMRRR